MLRLTRQTHRWLMLFAGLQLLIWAISGLYMVLVDIHFIHGEVLHKSDKQAFEQSPINVDIDTLLTHFPDATKIRLGWLIEKPVYRFETQDGFNMLDATTGKLIPSISKSLAAQVASSYLKELQAVDTVKLIMDDPPSEIGPRALPLWQVKFEGLNSLTLYINHQSGELVTTRHNGWRIFDVLWRLHIMDYSEGEDIDNLMLNVFTICGFLAVLAGMILLYFRLRNKTDMEQTQ